MTNLYFDIETIKTTRIDYVERVAANIKPPAQMKKAETIQKWEVEEKHNAVMEVVEKSVFNGGLCHIAQINYAFDRDTKAVLMMENGNEKENIQEFYDDLKDKKIDLVVGHNIIDFDLRILMQRSIVLGIEIPPAIKKAAQSKAWDGFVFDTMTRWAGVKGYVSMDDLCYYLGVKSPKSDMDGSEYGKYFGNPEYIQKLVAYGIDEVEALISVHEKMGAAA